MENNNSVCFVTKVNEIKEIKGADNIELAVVGGWNAITKKGEYSVGSRVIIATTDAVIPLELSEDMGVTNYLRKGNRVRTVKLRGVYSECLIIQYDTLGYRNDGDDMMPTLGITKYEPPIRQVQLSSGRKIKYRDNQNFHIYYKFPNLKNVDGMFTEEDTVEISRKIHGANARYGIVKKSKLSLLDKIKKFFGNKWIGYEYVYGSHNMEKGSTSQGFYSTDVWKTMGEKYEIEQKLWDYVKSTKMTPEIGNGIIVYGEVYGAGIQKGYEYGLDEIKFVGFDVKEEDEYLSPINAKLQIEHILELPYVDVLHFGNWSQELQDKYTFKNFIEGTKVPHEGIVIKYHTGERNKIAKVINPDYLIFGEKNEIGDSH
jgi:RNA ligase (TIGR02306 family)